MIVDFSETNVSLICEQGSLKCYRFGNQDICRVKINDQVTLPLSKEELQKLKDVILNGGTVHTKPPEELLHVMVLHGNHVINYYGHYRTFFITTCVVKRENIQPLLDFEW